jgi:hypothetical protein
MAANGQAGPAAKKAKQDEESTVEVAARLGVALPPADLTVRVPSALDRAVGQGASVDSYAAELLPRGKHLLLQFLVRAKGVKTRFEDMPLPTIMAAPTADCQSYKEMYNGAHAQVSLQRTALYECGGSGAWLNSQQAPIVGDSGFEHHLTWEAIENTDMLFTEQCFRTSAEEPSLRRFFFPGYYPTSIASLAPIAKAAQDHTLPAFADLPLYAGRAVHISWWKATVEALERGDADRVWALVTAMRMITIRLRLAPSVAQVILDITGWSLAARALKNGCCESLVEFVQLLVRMPLLKGPKVWDSAPNLAKRMQEVGLAYGGGEPNKTFANTCIKLAPLVQDTAFVEAFNRLRDCYPKLAANQKVLQRLVQAFEKKKTRFLRLLSCATWFMHSVFFAA